MISKGYLPISFQGYGIIFKKIKGIWDYTRDPIPGPHMPSQFVCFVFFLGGGGGGNRGTRAFTSGEQGTILGEQGTY